METPRKTGTRTLLRSRKVMAWAFYDWANSAYTTTVMAGFFPIFLKTYWSSDSSATSTFQLGMANSVASLVIVALAPILGAIADRGGARKRFLSLFCFLGVLMSAGLFFVEQGQWPLALAFYVLGTIGFSGGNVFYDSLIVSVTDEKKVDFVSALGYAFGYLGGGTLFIINVLMVQYPYFFGLADAAEGVRYSFLTVALWWAIFAIPIFLFVEEPAGTSKESGWTAIRAGFEQLRETFHEIRRLRVVLLFLIGYWLYIDGVDTIVRMAVDYGLALGFDQNSLLTALIVTQLVGIPAAIMFGKIGERLGPRTGIFICILVYLGITLWAVFITETRHFYAIAFAIGMVQGGIQALSRSMFARLIPPGRTAEFFGFYNMLGKFAAVIGPQLMGIVALLTGSPRLSILSVLILFIAGAGLLYKVDDEQVAAHQRRFSSSL